MIENKVYLSNVTDNISKFDGKELPDNIPTPKMVSCYASRLMDFDNLFTPRQND
jgi:hypothetical protein